MSIGNVIKHRRLKLDLTLDEVANAIGVNKSTIHKYESEEVKDIGASKIKPLAKILQMTVDELLDEAYSGK